MQFLSSLTSSGSAHERETTAATHLPYLRHVDPSTIELIDGLHIQTIKLEGLQFETADTDDINYRAHLRDAALRALGSSRFALYHHVVRREASDLIEAEYPDAFSRELNDRWLARLGSRRLYVNDLYLTIVHRPTRRQSGILARLRGVVSTSLTSTRAQEAADLNALHAASQALMSSLASYRPRLLAFRQDGAFDRSELVEFLSTLFNFETRKIALPEGPINAFLPSRRLSFGHDAFELGPVGHKTRRFGAMISIKDYPSQSFPGMFDALLRIPFEMIFAQSFAFVEGREASGRMNLALRRMRSTEDEALSLRDELLDARNDVAARKAAFGEHHLSIATYASSPEDLEVQTAEIISSMADLGIVAVREDIALEPTYWAQFPGNFKYAARKALVSTRNFASFASLHTFPLGRARNNLWGDAVSLLETTAAGPYFFNFHKQDLGNFTVIGPSGSGKTVVVNFLLAQARKFNPRIVFFDKDRGAELFIRALGGQYDRLRPGLPSGLNPLQIEDTPGNRQFLIRWIGILAHGLNEIEADVVKIAINANFAQPFSHRRLRHLVELMRGYDKPSAGDLYSRMRPWWGEGERAWLFDNGIDRANLIERTIGFDMTSILDDPEVRTPALLYFFHRVEQVLDGTPSIIVVDEGWKALDDEVFVRTIKDWEKTVRKRNGIVGFATQSAQDALESKISSAIIEQAATQIFMINPKARAEDYIDGFGLTEHELELVRTLPDNSHSFLIKHGNDSVVARLDLTGESRLITILSGREDTVRRLDEIVGDAAEMPPEWMDTLMERLSAVP